MKEYPTHNEAWYAYGIGKIAIGERFVIHDTIHIIKEVEYITCEKCKATEKRTEMSEVT